MPMKIREVIQLIEADGWKVVAQKGSHRQYKHATKPGRVTIVGKPGDDVRPGDDRGQTGRRRATGNVQQYSEAGRAEVARRE